MSYPPLPGVPDHMQPAYIQLGQASDRVMDEWRDVPRWRWLKRRRLRAMARTFAGAAAMSHLGLTRLP